MNMTQCRMARAALGWRAADLADASGIHRVTVARFEGGDTMDAATLAALRGAFEARGIGFTTRTGRISVSAPDKGGDDRAVRKAALADAGRAVAKVKRAIRDKQAG